MTDKVKKTGKSTPIAVSLHPDDRQKMKRVYDKQTNNYTHQIDKAIKVFYDKYISLDKMDCFPALKENRTEKISSRFSYTSQKMLNELLEKFHFSNRGHLVVLAVQECL
jgi:hypothetical protein